MRWGLLGVLDKLSTARKRRGAGSAKEENKSKGDAVTGSGGGLWPPCGYCLVLATPKILVSSWLRQGDMARCRPTLRGPEHSVHRADAETTSIGGGDAGGDSEESVAGSGDG